MPKLIANNLKLEYDEFGSQDHPAMLLIMGLGTQMTAWPVPLCRALANSGFRVIRFDNRDIGLSQKLEHAPAPGMMAYALNRYLGLPVKAPYALADMAADAVGVMDALDLPSAHVVGASMGGMIAQHVASGHPDRVRSLTSIMSSSGKPGLPQANPKVSRHLLARPKSPDREALLTYLVKGMRMRESPAYRATDEELLNLMERSIDRSYYPAGFSRQLAAIVADGSRVALLKAIEAPTLVVHGDADPLVPLACGVDTASHIPYSRLEVIEGMGHDLPSRLVPRLAQLIGEHASATENTPTAAAG